MSIAGRAIVCIALAAAPFFSAYACEPPSRVTMPDGYITLDEAIAAQTDVRNFMASTQVYLACLEDEIVVQSDPAEARKLSAAYNAAVDEMERVATQYNDVRIAFQNGTPAPTMREERSVVASTAQERDTGSGGSGSGVIGGIARAVAGIATGAGIAAAVTEGVPPEEAVELGMQVLGAIAGESPAAQNVGPGLGASVPSPSSYAGASPAQSAGNGQCEIPGFYDGVMNEEFIESVRLSWCPLVESSSQRRIFALYAETAWCRLNAEPPPENMSEFLQASRRTCDSLAALDEQARTATGPVFGEVPVPYVRCRCPAHYFQ